MQDGVRASGVVGAVRGAVRVVEVDLGQIAVQVLLSAAPVDAFHAALEDGEEAFNRVCVVVPRFHSSIEWRTTPWPSK